MNALLAEVAAGRRMSEEELARLYREADLLELGQAANRVRERLHPGRPVTFIIDRNINYTNICSCRCRFCAFYREEGADDAYVLSERELHTKIEEALALGATQVMIQGGLHPALDITWFEAMFRGIKQRYPVTVHSLTAPEVAHIARLSGLTTRQALERLAAAGLDSLPGGGAEILHDEVRGRVSPAKLASQEWLRVMEEAHSLGLPTTATMVLGLGEGLEHRIAHLRAIRALQDRSGGFRAFIMWTYQPGNNELRGAPVSSAQYLRMLALARLYLDNVPHVQGSWVTQGPQVGQLSLWFGADDLGSIMIEENVVRAAGVAYRMSLEEMVGLIRAAGKVPAQRDTAYRLLRVFTED
ncbi:MAG: cyclic dehypoxanthinyl futalosine synthase [Syntrophomonadaceae bacterium]|jgi:cyclic dehypoxanthinyl futalosine synthase|nr:dehypoxanthine futalosine cyclase [Syntrophomonadaceae bacterium]MDH7496937.1 cyclic dehypoxanthinyl futalosine synthase [Syntrophomonadaceae bacterium]